MTNVIILSAIIMLVLLFMNIPVFIAILTGAALYFIANPNVSPVIFAQRMISSGQSVTFLAVPFFAAAGALMNYTGVTRRIMDFCKAITGRMCGGLAQVNVLLSTLMIYIFNSAIGALSPPMGTLMFATCGVTKCKTKDFIKACIPFYVALVICLMIITFVPIFSTGLVDLIY